MSELIVTERENIVAIADAVRNKTGNTNEMSLGGIVSGINGIETGIDLPTLSNEGAASDLLSGKELIDDEGNVVTGTIGTYDGSYECSGESTGGSGSGIETCTVTITLNGCDISYIHITTYNGEKIESSTLLGITGTVEIVNVVCGTSILITTSSYGIANSSLTTMSSTGGVEIGEITGYGLYIVVNSAGTFSFNYD